MEKLRIAIEQMKADNHLLETLEMALKGWQSELKIIEQELIGQAVVDTKCNRYYALETRERELQSMIAEAERKIKSINERHQHLTTYEQANNSNANQLH